MSGRRIDDHSSPFGKAEEHSVFPDGAHHIKMERDVEGEGMTGHEDYPDTTEHIERDQSAGIKQIKSKPMKSGYRY
jgi:hypothetical protein